MTLAPAASLGTTPTDWALLNLAHASIPRDARDVWTRVFSHYDEPIRRSLRRLVRNPDVADDLNQEFWMRFLRGDFSGATPTRGRFRNLIKTVLIHLVADYYRRGGKEVPASALGDGFTLVARIANHHADDWRQELIERALAALSRETGQSKQVVPEALELEQDAAAAKSAEKAARLAERIGRDVSPENYRQILHRTRTRFAELIVDEVRHSLTDPTPETIREELAELDLLRYCGDTIAA